MIRKPDGTEAEAFVCGPDDVDETAAADEYTWHERGSDELMDFEVLVRVRREGQEADILRARKIRRRGE